MVTSPPLSPSLREERGRRRKEGRQPLLDALFYQWRVKEGLSL
jgi:hypothetical protein